MHGFRQIILLKCKQKTVQNVVPILENVPIFDTRFAKCKVSYFQLCVTLTESRS